jgi:hypothetical protein
MTVQDVTAPTSFRRARVKESPAQRREGAKGKKKIRISKPVLSTVEGSEIRNNFK